MENKTFLDKLENINEQLNLTHYWIILLKYKRILFITPILIAVLGYLVALNINPIFQSSATLVIEESVKNIVDIEEVYDGKSASGFRGSTYLNNQIQILESDEVIGSILVNKEDKNKILELYKKIPEQFFVRNFKFIRKNFSKQKKENINIKSYIKSNLRVSLVRNSDVVNLSITSLNPELAKLLLEQVIEAYLKYDVDTKVKVTNYANAQINLRLSNLLEQMEVSEKKLLAYKKENKLIDIGNIKKLKIDQITSVSQRIIETNRELQKKQTDLTAIKLAEGNIDELLAIADLRNKKEVDAIRTNINATNNNIQALQIIYTDEHPKVKKMFKTKNNLDNRLKEILDENIAAAAFELANL